MRAISERLQLSKTSVATYLLRAREAGLSWPLPPDYDERCGFGAGAVPPRGPAAAGPERAGLAVMWRRSSSARA